METVGSRIQRARKLLGWSVEHLASKTNRKVSSSTTRRIEDDDPKVGAEKIAVLCEILELEFDAEREMAAISDARRKRKRKLPVKEQAMISEYLAEQQTTVIDTLTRLRRKAISSVVLLFLSMIKSG